MSLELEEIRQNLEALVRENAILADNVRRLEAQDRPPPVSAGKEISSESPGISNTVLFFLLAFNFLCLAGFVLWMLRWHKPQEDAAPLTTSTSTTTSTTTSTSMLSQSVPVVDPAPDSDIRSQMNPAESSSSKVSQAPKIEPDTASTPGLMAPISTTAKEAPKIASVDTVSSNCRLREYVVPAKRHDLVMPTF